MADDMSRILTEALNLLNFWGAHPRKPFNCKSFARLFPCIALSVYGLYQMIQYTLINWKNVATIAENADGFPTIYQTLCKVIFMFYYRKELVNALETMKIFRISNLNPGSDLTVLVEDMHRKSNILYRVFRNVLMFGGILYALRPLLCRVHELPAPINLPCDMANSSCYISWYFIEILETAFAISFTIAAECLFFAFISYAYIELEAIKYGFRNLEFGKDFEREFALLVEQHDATLKFIAGLNKMYGMVLLQQFACQVAAICFLVFYLNSQRISLQLLLKTVPVLMAYHGELFVVCIAGNLLSIQALEVADALYECNWYKNLNPRIIKNMIMVMRRAQHPVKLTISGIWNLENAMFIRVIKTSFSVMALLQTFYDFSEQ